MPTPFEAFFLHPAVLAGLEASDVGAPTPLQEEVIPLILEGRDVVVHAGPHSGETLAYGLPVLSLFDPLGKPQVVVLVPSAERALRVYKKLAPLAQGVMKLAPLYEAGGPAGQSQIQAIKRGVDIVIGTPFVVKDLFAIKQLDLNNVRMIVLDGADRMMATVQRHDVEYLLNRLPRLEQSALFTWNVTADVEAIAHHLKDPAKVRAAGEPEAAPTPAPAPVAAVAAEPAVPKGRAPRKAAPKADAAKAGTAKAEAAKAETAKAERPGTKKVAPAAADSHLFARVPSELRADFLLGVLEADAPTRALVLARNKHEARRLALKLEKFGRAAVDNLNADTAPRERNATLARFRAGELRFLVVPEAAAKDLDFGGPGHVYLTGVGADAATYARLAEAAHTAGSALNSLTLVPPDAEAAFQALKTPVGLKRHPNDPGPAEPEPAPAPLVAETVVAAADAKADGRRGRGKLAAVKSGRDSAMLLNDSVRETKPATGPLAPLPRMRQTWQTFKVSLMPGQRPSRDTFHGWLSQTTGIARSSLRSIQLHKGYATVDVEERQVERFQQSLKDLLLG